MAMIKAAPRATIHAIIVLYQCQLAASHSVSSFATILEQHPELARHFSLMLYDNSPQAQACTLQCGVAVQYVHDASNGGLARAYNVALARAEMQGGAWLLLLDQDTSLTFEFLSELVGTSTALAGRLEIAAIAPKLLVNGQVYSPATAFTDQLRKQFRKNALPVEAAVVGVQQQTLYPYNSGSALRVSAVRSIGGFPEEFWLDFLDHATYHALFKKGFSLYLLAAGLVHDSSYADLNALSLWRFRGVLRAQALFLKKSGTFYHRLLFRIYLLRHSRSVRRAAKDPRKWKEALLQAFLLRIR